MTAYSATFANGTTKSLKNSRASYAAAWRVETQEPGMSPIVVTGFARDAEAAERASQSEARRRMKVSRWSPKGAVLISREVVSVTAS